MATELHVKSGGSWRKAKEVHVKASGAWRKCKEVWIKSAGTWRRTYPDFSITPVFVGGTQYGYFQGTAVGGGTDYGSVSPATAPTSSGNQTILSLYDNGTASLYSLRGNHAQGVFTSITTNGVTRTSAAATAFGYNSDWDYTFWQWASANFGFSSVTGVAIPVVVIV